METKPNSFEYLRKKYLLIVVRPQLYFDNESWLEHLRDFTEVVVEAIYHEPAVRALGRSQSDLVFRIFWILASKYALYGRRYCLPSKSDVVTDIFGFLQDLQRLYAVTNKPGPTSSLKPHTSPTH